MVAVILMLGILALLVWTNPDIETFENYQRSHHAANTRNPVTERTAVRTDYIVFSVYKSSVGDLGNTTVGLLDHFFVLS